MQKFTPKKSNNLDQYTLIGLLAACGVTMFFSSVEGIAYRSLLQLLSLMALTLALALIGRYRLKAYEYEIIPSEHAGYDLIVNEITRRSRITVCRISIDCIEKVVVGTSENKKQLKAERKSRKMFNYCVELCPAQRCCIFTEECGEPIYIELSMCEPLLEILRSTKNEWHPEQS